jgi:hypothetical protein
MAQFAYQRQFPVIVNFIVIVANLSLGIGR